MAHTYNVSNWEAEVGGQPGLHSKIMSQKTKNKLAAWLKW
jgi:hypothetical protein